jgi:hypothetical protein
MQQILALTIKQQQILALATKQRTTGADAVCC